MMSSPFPTLFSPLKIGPRTVKNRICCSAHAEAMAVDGMPTERTVRYYELKARGGVGFIMCFGSASVHPTSVARDWNGVELFDDRVVPHLARFSEAMHGYGVPCAQSPTGAGGADDQDVRRLYAPVSIRENYQETPRQSTTGR
jgi:2,4-dienoyl-CoA reductase-like NADH-dependent reductase (Old Yellow Enzyme family)